MPKTGPKLKETKGLKKARQITITIPSDMHDAILQIMQRRNTDNRSGVIQELIRLGLEQTQ